MRSGAEPARRSRSRRRHTDGRGRRPGAPDRALRDADGRVHWGHRFNVLRFFVGDGSMIVSDGDDHRRRGARATGVCPPPSRRLGADDRRRDRSPDRRDARSERRAIDLFPVGRRLVSSIVVRALFGPRSARAPLRSTDLEPAKTYRVQPRSVSYRIRSHTRGRPGFARAARSSTASSTPRSRRTSRGPATSRRRARLLIASGDFPTRDPRSGGHADRGRLRHDRIGARMDGAPCRRDPRCVVNVACSRQPISALGTIGTSALGPATLQQLPYAKGGGSRDAATAPGRRLLPASGNARHCYRNRTPIAKDRSSSCARTSQAAVAKSMAPTRCGSIPTVTLWPTDADAPAQSLLGSLRARSPALHRLRPCRDGAHPRRGTDRGTSSSSTSRPGRCRSRTGWL